MENDIDVQIVNNANIKYVIFNEQNILIMQFIYSKIIISILQLDTTGIKKHSSFYTYLVCTSSTKERETLKDSFEIKCNLFIQT